jgi:hypothetical protein
MSDYYFLKEHYVVWIYILIKIKFISQSVLWWATTGLRLRTNQFRCKVCGPLETRVTLCTSLHQTVIQYRTFRHKRLCASSGNMARCIESGRLHVQREMKRSGSLQSRHLSNLTTYRKREIDKERNREKGKRRNETT